MHLVVCAARKARRETRRSMLDTKTKAHKKLRYQKMADSQKIRIRLQAFEHTILDQSMNDIVNTVIKTGAQVAGPIPLPTKIERFTVNRSPHVDKKSMEQFEIRTHKRVIDIINPTSKTVDELRKLNLPAGVDIIVKL